MDHPAKRLKISWPDSRSSRDAGSRMSEGLFPSGLGMRRGNGDGRHTATAPTRTLSLSDFDRQKAIVPQRLPFLRHDGRLKILPRMPDATITSSVVDVNVNEGGSTVASTQVAVATDAVVISLSSLGTLTVPGVSTTTDTAVGTDVDDSSQTVLTTTPLSSDSSFTSSTSLAAASILTSALDSNGTTSITGSQDNTVTVTATSTFEVSYVNGTFATSFDSSSITKTNSNPTSSGNTFATSTLLSQGSSASFDLSSQSGSSVSYGIIATASNGSPGPTEAPTSSSPTVTAGSSSSASGSGGPGLSPIQQQLVGGLVGGVAGIAVILLVALMFLRWYRRHLKSQGRLPEQAGQRQLTSSGGDSTNPMSERSSNVPLAAAMASFGRRFRPQSANTLATTATSITAMTAPESERGFQRIAGRKIAPVLSAGGDGFGGNYGAFEKEPSSNPNTQSPEPSVPRDLAESSFYHDSEGFHGGKGGSPSPATPTSGPGHSRGPSKTRDFAADSPSLTATRPEGFAVMRPSPARTPVTRSPSQSSLKLPIQQGPTMEPDAPPTPALPLHLSVERGRDAIGRSLASQDGSRVSRASRGSGSRFSEKL